MYKTSVTFTNLDGEQDTAELMFHMNRAEVLLLDNHFENGIEAAIRDVFSDSVDMTRVLTQAAQQKAGLDSSIELSEEDIEAVKLVTLFQKIIEISYGVRQGNRFVKDNFRLGREFLETEEYAELLLTVLTDADKAVVFFNEVVGKPLKELQKES